MNLVDRYLSAVAQQLPAARRDDIVRELKANILDRLEALAEEQGRATTAADEASVLAELGHPQQVAAGFQPPRTLVNAEWFPFYTKSLAYGLVVIFVAQLIGFSISLVSSGHLHLWGLAGGLIQRTLIMFASVTGVFYLLSNFPATASISPYCKWKPEDLPPVRHSWQRINLCDSAGEFANNLFFLLVLQYPLWLSADILAKLPVGIGPGLAPWIMPITVWTLGAIVFNLWNLRFGYWTYGKLWFSVALNLTGSLLALGVLLSSADLVRVDHPLPTFIADHLQHMARWGVTVSLGIYLFWVARSLYRLRLIKRN